MTAARTSKRPYLRAADREQAIVVAATQFFAEYGFDGQLRELAKTMNITHSAIFRYFPTKDVLIDRVYEHVYLARWNPDWNALILDRSLPLEARLVRFYVEYADRIFHRDWVRIFVFAGMRAVGITDRYLEVVRTNLIVPVCRELRHALRPDAIDERPPTVAEEEAVWGLHGAVFYMAIRKFVYDKPIPENPRPVIEHHVKIFIAGVGSAEPPKKTSCQGSGALAPSCTER